MNSKIFNLRLLSKDGFIEVSSKGTLYSYFDITYILKGKQTVYVSPPMQTGQTKRIVIPAKSTDVKFRVFGKNRCGQWCRIFTKVFKTVPEICFTVIVTLPYVACVERPCTSMY